MSANVTGPRPSDKWIPWYIAGFFMALTALFSCFVYIAEKTYTGVVTDHAYERGLAYNEIIKDAAAQDILGFRPDIRKDGRKIVFSLATAEGKPVQVSKAKMLLFRPVQDGMDMTADMVLDDGVFTAEVSPPQQGLWEVRISAETAQGPYFTSKRMRFE